MDGKGNRRAALAAGLALTGFALAAAAIGVPRVERHLTLRVAAALAAADVALEPPTVSGREVTLAGEVRSAAAAARAAEVVAAVGGVRRVVDRLAVRAASEREAGTAAALAAAPPPAPSLDPPLDPGTELAALVEGRRIDFPRYRLELTPEARRVVDDVYDFLLRHPEARLEIGGHTDGRGDPAGNLELSAGRAAAVRDYLVERGIAGDRLRAAGYGSSRPLADEATAAGRRANRRVEFHLLPGD